MDKLNNTPPPWSEAPPWAMWRFCEENGTWKFSNQKPVLGREFWMYMQAKIKAIDGICSNPNWKTTLQKRPEDE